MAYGRAVPTRGHGPSDVPAERDRGGSDGRIRRLYRRECGFNTSTITHTVSAYDDGLPDGAEYFASGDVSSEAEAKSDWIGERTGALFQAETYEHTFEIPGVYSYFCVPHEPGGMVGRITVEDGTPTG